MQKAEFQAPVKFFSCTCIQQVYVCMQVKTYQMADEEEEVLEKSSGTKIEWRPGKNPGVKVQIAACGT